MEVREDLRELANSIIDSYEMRVRVNSSCKCTISCFPEDFLRRLVA